MKYIKEVEAVQFLGVDKGFSERPKWLLKAIYDDKVIRFFGKPHSLEFHHSDGSIDYAFPGSYAVKEVNGYIKPVSSEQFEHYYKEDI